ncbi:MAG: response regulator transcription factor [Bacteroidetes bacterium]|jgi:two-component system, OmpR family, alkaline phosphatase synthesis response regulator PhoP|nr:response regulator transcription factor [Bacteroidota bacterium]PHX83254.1 MAG: DNA-binding response regulator [Flavobacteriales bacterium]
MNSRILLVEDEENLLKTIRLNLQLEGYEVICAIDGASAVRIFESGGFDLIILDVMLPLLDGFMVCELIRKKDKDIPVLFLTAKSTGEDKIRGLRIGGDDYMTKPFNLEEFLLRVEILLRRSSKKEKSVLLDEFSFGKNNINFITFVAIGVNGTISLSKRELELLKLLIERKGEVVSRDEILEKLWGNDAFPTSRAIDNYILSFRKYFEINVRTPIHFFSIRGVGYKFVE